MSTAGELASMPRKAEVKLKQSLCALIPWYNMNENKSKTTTPRAHSPKAQRKTNNILSKKLNFSINISPVSQWSISGTTVNDLSEEKENEKETSASNKEERITRHVQQAFLLFFTTILTDYRKFFFKNGTETEGVWEWNRKGFIDEWSDKPSKVGYTGFLLQFVCS